MQADAAALVDQDEAVGTRAVRDDEPVSGSVRRVWLHGVLDRGHLLPERDQPQYFVPRHGAPVSTRHEWGECSSVVPDFRTAHRLLGMQMCGR